MVALEKWRDKTDTIHVLALEDNVDACALLKLFLEPYQGPTPGRYLLTCVESLKEGLRMLSEWQFDAILLDLELLDVPLYAGMQGESLKQIQKQTGAPVVIMTELRDEETEARLLSMGAASYVTKGDLQGQGTQREIENALLWTCNPPCREVPDSLEVECQKDECECPQTEDDAPEPLPGDACILPMMRYRVPSCSGYYGHGQSLVSAFYSRP